MHQYRILHGEKVLRANIAELKLAISDQNLELIPDYEQRVDVLKDLKFIDQNATVLLKGRVACEINSANELVLTELILENTLAAYDPEEVVALLSCFVFQEKTEVEPEIPSKLKEGLDAITAIAQRVERVQEAHKVPGEEFRGLKFGLVEVVYEWAKGMVRVLLRRCTVRLVTIPSISRSNRSLTSQTSPRVPLSVALLGWTRHAVKYAMRRASLGMQSSSRKWKRLNSRLRETVSPRNTLLWLLIHDNPSVVFAASLYF